MYSVYCFIDNCVAVVAFFCGTMSNLYILCLCREYSYIGYLAFIANYESWPVATSQYCRLGSIIMQLGPSQSYSIAVGQ